jgi:hypothetical protein
MCFKKSITMMHDEGIKREIIQAFQPHTPPLTEHQLEAAQREKILAYPQIIRCLQDRVCSDQLVLLSFLCGESGESYVKIRGIGDHNSLRERARQILQNEDSKTKMIFAPLGKWLPVTNEPEKFTCANETILEETANSLYAKMIKQRDTELNRAKTALIQSAKPPLEDMAANEDEYDIATPRLSTYIHKRVCLKDVRLQERYFKAKLNLLESWISALINLLSSYDAYDPSLQKSWMSEYKKIIKINEDKLGESVKDMLYVSNPQVEANPKLYSPAINEAAKAFMNLKITDV